MLYYLFKLWKAGRIDDYSIVVDSPLAVEATRIFAKNVSYFDDEAIDYLKKHGKLPEMPQLRLCESAEESKALNSDEGSKIILSASGMADAGRVLHHLKHNLWRPESTVLFVGYQAEGSLGRRLLDGAKQVKVMGEEISVKARIMNMDGFSAHADYTQIEEWLQHLTMNNAQQVFVVHGEATAAKAIKENDTGRVRLERLHSVLRRQGDYDENVVRNQGSKYSADFCAEGYGRFLRGYRRFVPSVPPPHYQSCRQKSGTHVGSDTYDGKRLALCKTVVQGFRHKLINKTPQIDFWGVFEYNRIK